MRIIYAYANSIPKDDLSGMKMLGYDTVIGDFTQELLDWMLVIGLKAIPQDKTVHKAVCAYYLYDEPDLAGVSIEGQDAKIAEYRAFTSLPLVIACTEATTVKCSKNFDWYLLDIYYNTETMSKTVNYLNGAFSSQFIQLLYPGKVVLPILGIFDDNTVFKQSPEQLPFARFIRGMYPHDDFAAFIWYGDSGVNGIMRRSQYVDYAKTLNSTTDEHWYRSLVEAVSWLFLKINNVLPEKWRIVI